MRFAYMRFMGIVLQSNRQADAGERMSAVGDQGLHQIRGAMAEEMCPLVAQTLSVQPFLFDAARSLQPP